MVEGDRAGHEVLLNPAVKQQLRRRFGDCIFDQQGEVDRSALARLVFGPGGREREARKDLEQIVHPEIGKRLAEQIATAGSDPETEAVLLDAAVLLEAGWHDLCDAVVFVDTPEPIRRARVLASRGWTAEQFRQREESQMSVEDKRCAADDVIENLGSPASAADELERIVDRVRDRKSGDGAGSPNIFPGR